jgi:hypothetical protein
MEIYAIGCVKELELCPFQAQAVSLAYPQVRVDTCEENLPGRVSKKGLRKRQRLNGL